MQKAASVGVPGEKPSPSPNKVLAVACCKLIHDKNGNTMFICRYPGCEKTYASRDAVRKHCRIHHLAWLRTLERVTTHEEEVSEETLPIRTQKRGGGGGGPKKKEKPAKPAGGADGADPLLIPLNPFSPTLSALPSADELLESLPIDLLNPDELMWGVDALATGGLTPRSACTLGDAVARKTQPAPALPHSERLSDPLRGVSLQEPGNRDSAVSMGVRDRNESTEVFSATLGMGRDSINESLAHLGMGRDSAGRASSATERQSGGPKPSAAAASASASAAASAAAYINPSVSPCFSASRSPLYTALGLGAKEGGGEGARRLASGASPALTATPRTSLFLAQLASDSNGATPRDPAAEATPRSSLYAALATPDEFGLGSPARGTAAAHAAVNGSMGSMAAPPPRRPAAAPAADPEPIIENTEVLRTLLGSGLF